jgi:D-arabinose 1-dehydrogenase-like Zn-dependent alcohol dehydrogenase
MANITLQRIKSEYIEGKIKVTFADKSRPEIGQVNIVLTPKGATQADIQATLDLAADEAIAKFKEKIAVNKIEKILENLGKPDQVYKGDIDAYVNKQKV